MLLNIYKPKGFTSFDIVAKVRRQLNIKKVGHAGTLDPLAEGVLVVLTGDDTKKQDDIMKQAKTYEAEITFGAYSPTLDLECTPKLIRKVTLTELKENLPKFFTKYLGEIKQLVPDYSAKKIHGKPMYELARKPGGLTDQVPIYKDVIISDIKVLAFGEHEVLVEPENTSVIQTDSPTKIILPYVVIKVECSHGTYLRALARDFGNDLTCGAVLTKLVRTRVGNYSIENALPLANVK